MAKDSTDSMREPQWLDLGPVRCIGIGSYTVTSPHVKAVTAIIVLDVEQQILMSRILKSNLESVKMLIQTLSVENGIYLFFIYLFNNCGFYLIILPFILYF